MRIQCNANIIDTLEKKLMEIIKLKEERRKKGEIVSTITL